MSHGAENDVPLSPGWWAGCIDCGVTTIIDKGDSPGVPDPAEWDGFPSCIVCGGSLSFDEASESQWDRESRLMRAAREAASRPIPPTEGHPCGHSDRTSGCGGCDPGAVEFVRDDGGSWTRILAPAELVEPNTELGRNSGSVLPPGVDQ